MRANLSFEEFLRQLATQRGTTGKLRLAARYWRQVKSLSAAERERVALALGSQVAWKQLERLFLRDGTLSEDERAVQEALDRLGEADPDELRRWAAQLRHTDRRRVSDLVATAVQAALEQEAEEIGRATPAPGGAADEATTDSAPAPAPPAPASMSGPPAASPQASTKPSPVPFQTSAPPAPAPPPSSTRPAASPPPASGLAPSIRSPIAEDEARHGATRSHSSDAWPLVRVPEPGLPSVARPASHEFAGVAALPGRFPEGFRGGGAGLPLSAVQRLRELRELRENPAGVAALGAAGRAELVAKLGPGWASRRAVSELIRGGAVTGVDESLRLIAQLDTPVRQSWCLGVLIDHMRLSAAERERVLEAAPTAAARRRLARRLDSSGAPRREL
jgi:hypothetical protein